MFVPDTIGAYKVETARIYSRGDRQQPSLTTNRIDSPEIWRFRSHTMSSSSSHPRTARTVHRSSSGTRKGRQPVKRSMYKRIGPKLTLIMRLSGCFSKLTSSSLLTDAWPSSRNGSTKPTSATPMSRACAKISTCKAQTLILQSHAFKSVSNAAARSHAPTLTTKRSNPRTHPRQPPTYVDSTTHAAPRSRAHVGYVDDWDDLRE